MNDDYAVDLSGITDDDIRAYLLSMGIDPNKPISGADQTKLTTAQKTTDTSSKTFNTVSTILAFLNTEIGVLSKAGIIGKQTVAEKFPTLANVDPNTSTDSNNAPGTGNGNGKVFGIDFTSPTTLVIVFAVFMLVIYFLFFNKKSKNGKH